MNRESTRSIPFVLALTLVLVPGARAQDEWKFGLGMGFTSFSLDGDIGFPTPGGGVIFDVDLDNSDTSDLVESGFGLAGYAARGKWKILYSLGTATLEDDDDGLEAEWDRAHAELAGVYNFARTGNHRWDVLFGVRHIAHDWMFTSAMLSAELDESWTDGLIGITHAVPFGSKWAWANRLDGGFGDSEGSFFFSTAVNRRFGRHWSLGFSLKQSSVEFGDEGDIADSDFYLYDVDEPGVGIGFMYMW